MDLFIFIGKEAFDDTCLKLTVHAFQVKGEEKPEEILGRGFIEDKLCELGLGEVTIIWGNPKIQTII